MVGTCGEVSQTGQFISGEFTPGQFALVSYIPEPLAAFLDRVRLELTPDSKPRAHVTVLPPRPALMPVAEAEQELAERCRSIHPFHIEAGNVELFPGTNVIYIGISRGEREVRAAHELLNEGRLAWECPFQYHPHITLAQGLTSEQVDEKLAVARQRWAEYEGPRGFEVMALNFVHSDRPLVWKDLAQLDLNAVPVRS